LAAVQRVGSRSAAEVLQRTLAYQLPAAVQRRLQALRRARMLGLRPEVAQRAVQRHDDALGAETRTNLPRYLAQLAIWNLPRLLRAEDRNSMAFSIEARTPFLDVRLAEYVSQLPAVHRLHAGWSKYTLRRALEGVLPAEIVWRRDKKGFVTPEGAWLRALRPRLQALFNDQPRLEPWLDMPTVRATLAHDAWSRDKTANASIWRWSAAEIWLRMLEHRREDLPVLQS
ncbi:MAG: asparagine synthase-related protein, partial [Anaerolineae bacterium]|nr:asparagine synthase C-terminal domain-containing protein [Thermoflexales bacterium]MDW8408796.1 asparagine synthase-related protein [Anaerolineae bacterium]